MKGRLRNVGAHSEQARVWFLRLLSSIVVWTVISHLSSLPLILRHPIYLSDGWPTPCIGLSRRNNSGALAVASEHYVSPPSPSSYPPKRIYKSNGYLRVSCNGGLNQMRAAFMLWVQQLDPTLLECLPDMLDGVLDYFQICDMVTIARFLNLTLLIPELDKTSFWADPSDFKDIFNARHFINSLRDEVKIVKLLPKKFNQRSNASFFSMPPVSWSNQKYYLKEILPLVRKLKVIHFNKTDARLANNGLPVALQKLRCQVNYEALKFTPQIEAMGNKLISVLQKSGFFIVLHLRYEMDMLAFSGCTHGCSESETHELARMRYSYPWWKEKEIVSEKKRLEGQCPLTPEETALVLQALGIEKNSLIYIASGEIYGGERRLAALRAAYPKIVRKEMLLSQDDLKSFQNHSTQMAALDYMVSVASNVFVPTYYGNMAKVVEGHRRYLGFRRTILLERRGLVELLDLYQNSTISWDDFAFAVRDLHKHLMGQPRRRKVIGLRPKEEDYFYANPEECLGPLSPESTAAIT